MRIGIELTLPDELTLSEAKEICEKIAEYASKLTEKKILHEVDSSVNFLANENFKQKQLFE